MTNPSAPSPRRAPSGAMDFWHGFRLAFRRWAHDTFNREAMAAGLRQLIFVAPLTVLIFVYAEQEQRHTEQAVSFVVGVHSTVPGWTTTLLDPANDDRPTRTVPLMADLTGTDAKLEQVQADLAKTYASPLQIPIPTDLQTQPGKHSFPVNAVSQEPLFVNNYIAVSSPKPATLTVLVEKVATRTVALRLPADLANHAANVVFEPRQVSVVGPTSLLDAAAARASDGVLTATVDLSQVPGVNEVRHHEETVPVIAPTNDDRVTVQPATVKVSFDTKPADAQAAIPSVVVFVLAPPTLLDRYKVELRDSTVQNITVTGSPDVIAQLQSGQMADKPKAFIDITGDDAAKTGWQTHAIRFELPPGIHQAGDTDTRTAAFRVTERQADGAG